VLRFALTNMGYRTSGSSRIIGSSDLHRARAAFTEHLMRSVISALSAAVIMLLGGCAAEQARQAPSPASMDQVEPVVSHAATASTNAPQAEAALAKDDPIICHKQKRVGTLFGKQVCMRRSEIKKGTDKTREQMNNVLRGAGVDNCTETPPGQDPNCN
jgi:hypothetical protein